MPDAPDLDAFRVPCRSSLDGLAIELISGPDEIQRNIVGERILGLPREPAVDRDVPFSELANGIQRNQLAEHVLGLPH